MKIRIPKEVQSGGVTYQVKWDESARQRLETEGCNGQCNKQDLIILISPKMARVAQTFIHEIVHAIDYEYCQGTLTEVQVDSLATGFLQVLRQLGIELVLEE